MQKTGRAIAAATLLVAVATGVVSAAGWNEPTPNDSAFVKIEHGRFIRHGNPYTFIGANFWGALYLGRDVESLRREVDHLARIGVKNLRVMAAFEGPDHEPWRMAPATQPSPGVFDEQLLQGLDRLLFEAAQRDLTVVLTLGNFWPWSGGFGQHVAWANELSSIPYPPPAVGGDWNTYQSFVASFYSNPKARASYLATIEKILTRVNTVSGVAYRDDPTIMSWQLGNEPRGFDNQAAFREWISETTAHIKRLDPNHLVSVGTEGETANPAAAGLDVLKDHASPNVDYITTHLWVQNWEIYDPARHRETFPRSLTFMRDYLKRHVEFAKTLGKPLVVEEFGIARDQGSFDPDATTHIRDEFFRAVFNEVIAFAKADSPLCGVNFWAWSGEARPRDAGGFWRLGDSVLGDPPHEQQGWYGVYDQDTTTLEVIRTAAENLQR